MPVPAYDVEAIRRDFRSSRGPIYGKPLVYLDNGAVGTEAAGGQSTPSPMPIPMNMPMSIAGLHFLSNAATDAYEGAREKSAPLSERAVSR